MAAIDFPASPTNGQVFNAPNGVTYVYDAPRTVWMAQPTQYAASGDFCATGNPPGGMGVGSYSTLIWATVYSGNAGGWYNPATGAFKPPKGRYKLSAVLSGYYGSGATQLQMQFRKNGVAIPNAFAVDSSAGANYYCAVNIEVIVDANGTDTFDTQGVVSPAWTAGQGFFNAIPVTPNGAVIPTSGDFVASSQVGIGANVNTVMTPAVISGNSGNWYNPGTGRYTPPAGRYFIWGSWCSGYSGAATANQMFLRKNGAQIGPLAGQVPGTANWYGDPSVSLIVDANGTDYFDAVAYSSAGANLLNWQTFGAFPISGVKGPQGDPGAVGSAGANPWNIRLTTSGFAVGNNYTSLFRAEGTPTKDYDPDGVINTAAAYQFTAPNAGRYHFHCQAYIYHTGNGQGRLALHHSNSANVLIRNYSDVHFSDTNGYGSTFVVDIDVQMAAGDHMDFFYGSGGTCYPIAVTTMPGLGQTEYLCWANGHRIN